MPSVELVLVIIIGIGVVILGLVVLGKLGWVELRGPLGFMARRHVPPDGPAEDPTVDLEALRLALEEYGEVAVALGELAQSQPGEVQAVARAWMTMLATRLALQLKKQRNQHYRVAIWLDDPNFVDHFVAIGHGMFDHNDENMEMLERKYTIGGLAFESATGSYYCRDAPTDPKFKPRNKVPPRFKSVFGLALGRPNDRWGVMTVDARQSNGFPDDSQWLIRRFGELASLGAVIWQEKIVAGQTGPSAQAGPGNLPL